jgi:predicted helicase
MNYFSCYPLRIPESGGLDVAYFTTVRPFY